MPDYSLPGSESSRSVAECPICRDNGPHELIRTHDLELAAEYFVPLSRDPARNQILRGMLEELWEGRGTVDVLRCRACTFGFPAPYVAAGPEFYEIAYQRNPHYPRHRWEYSKTVEALTRQLSDTERTNRARLLEVGAGDGRFLCLVRDSPVGRTMTLEAIEYDLGAIQRLSQRGFPASRMSIQDLATQRRMKGQFGAICMFHVLEHMADVHDVFCACSNLLVSCGDLFISVPNGASIDQQEDLVQFWDMPPNHVGRWSLTPFQRIAAEHGMTIIDYQIEPARPAYELWRLAVWRINAQSYAGDRVAERINRWTRVVRGPVKRLFALRAALDLASSWGSLVGHSQWIHMQRASRSEQSL